MYTAVISGLGIWRSYKALQTRREDAMLRYWTVFACFLTYERYVDWVVRWIPGSTVVKCAVLALTFGAATDLVFLKCVLPLTDYAKDCAAKSFLLAVHFLFHFFHHKDPDWARPRKETTPMDIS